MVRARRLVALPVCAALSLASGCGSEAPGVDAAAETESQARQIVSGRQVAAAPPGSPTRTLLAWWRSMQYRNPHGARELFTPEARATLGADFESLLYRDFGPWLQHARPEIDDVETSGREATAFLTVKVKQVLSPRLVRQSRELVAIPFERVRGRWLVSGTTFFDQNAQRLREARAAERESAPAAS